MPKQTEQSKRHGEQVRNLYVIRLDDEVLKRGKFLEANPDYQPGKPCVYVGITSHDPAVRFNQHKEGHKASRIGPTPLSRTVSCLG